MKLVMQGNNRTISHTDLEMHLYKDHGSESTI